MKLRKLLTALTASAAAVVLSFTLASPAQAHDEAMNTDDDNPGGRVEFTANGDVVKLCDTQDDGHGVMLRVFDDTSHIYKYNKQHNADQPGKCWTYRASMGGDYNLREDNLFQFTICLLDDTVHKYCDEAYWKNFR
ncbi:MAG: hypothetical protein ACRDXX_16565 [Stackebrandtia sp.]